MSMGLFALQSAIYSRLNSDGNLTTTLGASIFDDVPENPTYPFVGIGQDTSVDFSTKDANGSENTITLDIFSRYLGSKETKDIMDRVHTLLHDAAITVSGQNLINIRFEFGDILREPDGLTRHGVMRFRAIML